MQGRGHRPFFECSAQPIVSLRTNELNGAVFLPSGVDSATVQNLFFRMKRPLRSLFALPAFVLAGALTITPLFARSDMNDVEQSVGRLLEEGHYTHHPLNDEGSQKFLKTYLELLDFSHLFFTQADVDALTSKYGVWLDDAVLLKDLKPAYEIYALYTKRVDDRVAKIKEQLNQPPDSKNDASIELSRQKAPWPKDEAEADAIWHGRIASELLQEHLSEHPIEPGPKLIAKRYDRLARNVHEQDKDEQVKLFLDALAQAYDPHSEYLSKADLKNFSINMGLSLVGIGGLRENRKPGSRRTRADRWTLESGRPHHRGRAGQRRIY